MEEKNSIEARMQIMQDHFDLLSGKKKPGDFKEVLILNLEGEEAIKYRAIMQVIKPEGRDKVIKTILNYGLSKVGELAVEKFAAEAKKSIKEKEKGGGEGNMFDNFSF